MINNTSNNGFNSGIMVGENKGTINNITQESCKKLPSLIIGIVEMLADLPLEDDNDSIGDITPFKTIEKIEYNNIIKYKDIIKEYSIFYTYCEDTLAVYDNSNIGAKRKILQCIKTWYLEVKGQLLLEYKDANLTDIEIIKSNADLIIDRVKAKTFNLWKQNLFCSGFNIEDVELGINCFTCYCFMECKILEKPK